MVIDFFLEAVADVRTSQLQKETQTPGELGRGTGTLDQHRRPLHTKEEEAFPHNQADPTIQTGRGR